MQRRVFTYSRKKPIVSGIIKTTTEFIQNDENRDEANDYKMGRKRSSSTESALDTPQTKRHKDIRALLNRVDRKLNLLALSENIDFSKFYRHKGLFLSGSHANSSPSAADSSSRGLELKDLLEFLRQTEVLQFSRWFELNSREIEKIEKLNEATFSEVFKLHGIDENSPIQIIKIIPLKLQEAANEEQEHFPIPITFDSAIHECRVLKKISGLKEYRAISAPSCWTGFNQIVDIRVLQGSFPAPFLEAWDSWNESNGSENASPQRYDLNQLFLTITMEDGGRDLDSFKVRNLSQVKSIILQLALALGLAEEKLQFEHRDLHLGNVLIKEISEEVNLKIPKDDGEDFILPLSGIQCSIIDYSLSRMQDRCGPIYRDLNAIPWLFEGNSDIDYQFQVYRDVRDSLLNDGNWSQFNPRSNIVWLIFVLKRLLDRSRTKRGQLWNELNELLTRLSHYSSVNEFRCRDVLFSGKT